MTTSTSASHRPLRKAAVITTVVAVALFVLGLAALAVTYSTEGAFPVPGVGNLNILLSILTVGASVTVGIAAVVLWIIFASRRTAQEGASPQPR